MRKTSRGASRTQRRRRSKSPILHPPKFTYCSTTAAAGLSPPSVCLKHQRLAMLEPAEPRPAVDARQGSSVAVTAQKELSPSGTAGHISPVVFGSPAGYETHMRAMVSPPSLQGIPTAVSPAATSSRQDAGDVQSSRETGPEKSACDGAEYGAARRPADATDFGALSKQHSSGSAEGSHIPCTCTQRNCPDSRENQEESTQGPECQCRSRQGWNGVEVYSFTGLRHVISECERNLPGHGDATRTLSTNSNAAAATSSSSTALTSGSPRSCSEQARAYVDDITIEDLSGYMEYYLYIPKKMSHMAEMMYT